MNSNFTSTRRRLLALTGFFSFALFSATNPASAAVTWHNVQFGGFFSQGYLDSTNNNYPVETKDGTFDFREYAINASTTFGNHFRLGAQVFAQKLGKYGKDQPILDWAVADYNFRQEFGLRVGRVKYPRSLHSDVLDADVLRPFVFLPQSIYDARLRDFQASFDGAMAYGTFNAGSSSFDYKIFYGKIPMKTDSGVGDYFNTTSLFANPPGVTQLDLDTVRGATLAWNTPIAGLRAAIYYSEITRILGSGKFAALPAYGSSIDLSHIKYTAGSLEYTKDLWTFAAEYFLEAGDAQVGLPAFLPQPAKGRFGDRDYYFSVARRVTDKLELGTYYSYSRNPYASASTPSAVKKREDWTVSGRYDVNDHLLFKLEVHFINGEKDMFNVTGISNPPGSLKNSMMLFAAKTTLSF